MHSDTSIKSFHVVNTPIEKGLTLLEAGAGTGKTYSLVRVIARHLVENKLNIDEILTVTFTVAATAEIKGRLHTLLSEIATDLKVAITHRDSENQQPFTKDFNDLVEGWYKTSPQTLEDAQLRISTALAHFDSVPIFTIDGFFNRLLREHAFEANALFSMDLDPEEEKLILTAIRDYWRQYVYPLDADELATFDSQVKFDAALKFITEALRSPNASFDKSYDITPSDWHKNLKSAWKTFFQIYEDSKEDLKRFLSSPPDNFNKRKAPFPTKGAKTITALDELVESLNYDNKDPKPLLRICSSFLESKEATKDGTSTDLSNEPAQCLFYAADKLIEELKNLKTSYYGEILHFVRKRTEEIKKERNVQSHSDITNTLAKMFAENTTSASSIQKSVQSKFNAALIDEFQDTSPEQCQVFLKLFHDDALYFHIIGDPKQSIYRFRGADVFSYIQASNEADKTLSLLTNFRSTPRMIYAVNRLFSMSEDPFLVGGKIKFSPAKWQGQVTDEGAEKATPPDGPAALVLHPISPELGSSENIKRANYRSIAFEITKLLGTDWSVYDSEKKGTITPSDIAILTRSKAEGTAIGHILGNLNIPVTLNTKSSLIESEETNELFAILAALLEPRKADLLRTALLTPELGGGELLTQENEAEFDTITYQIVEFQQQWHRDGLMPMMLRFVAAFQIRTRLLTLNQGQRRLTNFMHLIELIDHQARKEKLTPEATLQWLEMAIQDSELDVDSEARELRIATDDAAVQIRTQHTSKGLEFSFVFSTCPCFQTVDTGKRRPSLTYHDPITQETCFDAVDQTDKASETYILRKQETLADSARLTYVAVTRAKYLCHFYIVPVEETKTARKIDEHAIYQMLGEPSPEELEKLARESNGTIVYQPIGQETLRQKIPAWSDSNLDPEHPEPLNVRDISQTTITHNTRVTSFTGITHAAGNEAPFAPSSSSSLSAESDNTFTEDSFWGELRAGADLGNVFHETLEDLDFQNLENAAPIIEKKLIKHSPWKGKLKEPDLRSTINNIESYLEKLVNHSLDGSTEESLKLKDISLQKRMTEPAFLLSGSGFSLSSLSDILADDQPAHMPVNYISHLRTLPKYSIQGFLNGFIDLAFEHNGRYHLLDWKTNQLDNYRPESIAASMAEHHYYLQYHLYTLALDRFLAQRLSHYDSEKHLGNTYYIYLRGIDPDTPGSGIFTDKLTPNRLGRLRRHYRNPHL